MREGENELTWLQDFDDNSLVGQRVDSLVDFGILASADLLDDLVVVLGPVRMGRKGEQAGGGPLTGT